jgi:hypothetical protein
MTVGELIQRLQQLPSNMKVILAEELGASELEDDNIKMETMNYVEYPPYWEHHSPSYGWEFQHEYVRKVLYSEEVVAIY